MTEYSEENLSVLTRVMEPENLLFLADP